MPIYWDVLFVAAAITIAGIVGMAATLRKDFDVANGALLFVVVVGIGYLVLKVTWGPTTP